MDGDADWDDDEYAVYRGPYGARDLELPMSSDLLRISTNRVLDKERRKLIRLLDSVPTQVLLLVLILWDVSLTVFQIASDIAHPEHAEPTWMFGSTLFIVTVLIVEVLLRMFGLGFKHFFRHWYNTLDLFVSVASLVLEVRCLPTLELPWAAWAR